MSSFACEYFQTMANDKCEMTNGKSLPYSDGTHSLINLIGSSSRRLLASQGHARTRRPRDQTILFISYVTLNEANSTPLSNHSRNSAQVSFPDRLQKIDLQLQRSEGLALPKISRVSETHGRVSDITKDSTMQCAHRISVGFSGLKLNDSFPRFN
jgi:hypothetical protein